MRIALITLLAALAGSGQAEARDWRDAPVVPRITGSIESSLERRLDDAVAAGNRPGVFAKLGDSITESQAYLRGLGCGEGRLAEWDRLRPTIDFFHGERFPDRYTDVWCGYADSWSRASAAAETGKTAAWVTDGGERAGEDCDSGESPFACEYRLLKPAWSLVMFGTNDAGFVSPGAYHDAIGRIVDESLARGTIPILSTIPPRLDDRAANRRTHRFNAIVHRIARANELPLVNFWRATQAPRMINQGIHSDGIHPNVFVSYECEPFCEPLDFSSEALRYGYNQRNLITLRTLDRIRRTVIEG